nr:MAG TPA: hypothetical protein [Caudoviricetes sp.]
MRVAKAILFVYTYLIPTFSFVFSIQGTLSFEKRC